MCELIVHFAHPLSSLIKLYMMNTFRFFGIALFFMLMGIGFSACNAEYNDEAVWQDIEKLKQKVAELETLCKKTNENIASLQKIVNAVENADYVEDVTPITNDGVVIGYQITFARKGVISLYNGNDGETPVIGVKKDKDGGFYWTVNGEFVMVDGQKVSTQRGDGNGSVPQFKIEDGYWYISYNGTEWKSVGKAHGGSDGNGCVFSSVTQDDDYVYFTLADGTLIKISKNASSGNEGDDDDPVLSTIVGKWILTDLEVDSAFGEPGIEMQEGDWIEFKSNLTCSWRQEGEIVNGKYKVNNNILSIYDIDDIEYIPCDYQIIELTAKNLVLKVDWGALFKSTMYFERS